MIDLSSQPKDGESDINEVQAPRHDAIPGYMGSVGKSQPILQSSHERAEASVQFLSRLAGPAILIASIAALLWFAIG